MESVCIPNQPEGIHSPEQTDEAIPKIVQVARERFADKDMILVSCAEDPGVEEIRAAMPGMPVTGGGECAVAAALRYGERVGVLGIVDYAPKAYRRLLGDRLVGNFRPEGVNCTLDLQTPEGHDSCVRTAQTMAEAGCEAIALGCTGLGTIGIAAELERVTGIPVIDPVVAMGAFATLEAARKQRLS